MINLDGLRDELDGELFVPGSPGYEDVRGPANPAYRDARPRTVIRCSSVADVARGIRYAREAGIPIVPRGGGHCFAGRSSTDGIVLDLAGLDAITVTGGGHATIGAGARLADVYTTLHLHGRTIPAGCGATVGIAGLTLGGGIGLLGRSHGLTCDRLVGARIVLVDGRVIDCDADREPELFWALRGAGGGQFGVVTSLVFDTVPEPMATRFELRWSLSPDHAAHTVAAWQHWAPGTPDGITANLTLTAEPGEPPKAVLFGASLREEAVTRGLLEEFRGAAGADPVVDVRGGLPFHRLKASFDDLDPCGERGASVLRMRSELFERPMRPSTTDALLSTLFSGKPEGRRQLAFTAMGGAYNRVPETATAFAHRSELFMLQHTAEAPDAWIDRSWDIAHADGSGRVYPNFPDSRLDDWAGAYHAGNHSRLAAAKKAYDPDRLLDFPQCI
ncbi:FAD-binding oxidoreductase [Actinomadura rudentiformis]|uniref:FAD-binding oxidoreductase n=1 Tax=Actinomadura rudentiformis TaxID=359158 RepID=A0A6H9YWJ2_9ACTN|nr:FAD-binding oxidoreductase [Actinomadura rudentiformis]KAB2349116.1 FAD-binding oxidoreductase [Actinomadura rudentiformis]